MKSYTKQTLKIFWQHALKYKGMVFLMLFVEIFAVAANVATPFLFKNFFNVLTKADPNAYPILLNILFGVVALNLVGWAGWRSATFLNSVFCSRVMSDLTKTCFEYLHQHSYNFFNNNFSGSLTRRVNKYSRSFEDLQDVLYWDLIQTVIKLAFIIVVVTTLFPIVGVVLLVWLAIYITFQLSFARYKLKFDIARSEADSELTARLSDTITNNVNIKLFNGFKFEFGSFDSFLKIWKDAMKKSWFMASWAELVQSFLMIGLEFLVFFYCLKYWRAGVLSVGDFVLLQAYMITIWDNLWGFGRHIRKIYEAMSDANEMTEILLTDYEVKDIAGAKDLVIAKGEIEFKNAVFEYKNQQRILQDFNVKIAGGERVALIGPSGGGKSTISRLIFRFFDLNEGQILIDGQDISKATLESIRENISLVPQEPILFHRSLMENIRYGKRDATDAEVFGAAKLAHAHEFISKFPQGYATLVGERGVKLSGGERQRVAIARAILKNAPILVLDEATSSLDSESEKFIQDAMKNLMKGKTTIVIAHRLSTIMSMDRILVISDGKIIESGDHHTLLHLSEGTYQKLWGIQAAGFSQ